MLDQYKLFTLEQDSSLNINKKTNKEVNCKLKVNDNVVSKIKSAISEFTFKSDVGSNCEKYILYAIDEQNVVVVDREAGYKAYAVPYLTTEIENDLVVSVDFENKIPKSLIVGDKKDDNCEFDFQKELKEMSNLVEKNCISVIEKENNIKFSTKIAELNLLIAENKSLKSQILVFASEKEEIKKQNSKNSVDSVISTYANIMGKYADFLTYRATLDYTKDINTIEQELKIMYADFSLVNAKKNNYSANFVESGIVNNRNLAFDVTTERYGDLLSKF